MRLGASRRSTSITGSCSERTGRSCRSGRVRRRWRSTARRACPRRRCARTSRSWASRAHDVHLDEPRIRRLAIDAIEALSDEELAARAGAPPQFARALRGARDLVEARAMAAAILEPRQVTLPEEARPTLTRFAELRASGLDGKDIVRELKAVGGDLKALRLALTGAERGPELWTVIAALPPGRGADGGSMRLYSTLARGLVELPTPPGPIGMYVCGPTVYARAHIGNARPYVVVVVVRALAARARLRGHARPQHHRRQRQDLRGGPGRQCRARRARRREWYLEDIGRFGLDEVDFWPKVTESMDEIVAFIADLVERGFAYEVDGDVYFRVARWAEYGRLSGQKPDQVEEQEPNPRKEDPRDFALWKANKPGEDTFWESPWGHGRPGWHIECSAMAEKLLGPVLRDPRRRSRPRLSPP